jgi:starvation-inducible DNA-binding protein
MRKKLSNSSIRNNKVPNQLATPHVISTRASEEIAAALNPLVADAFALYVKTKNFHWHASGPNFRDRHLLFDEQAGQIFEMIDVLAERVRKLGQLTIHSVDEIKRLTTVRESNQAYVTPESMVEQLREDNEAFSENLRKAHEICAKHEDVATTSIIEVLLDETERRVWFLFESYQK